MMCPSRKGRFVCRRVRIPHILREGGFEGTISEVGGVGNTARKPTLELFFDLSLVSSTTRSFSLTPCTRDLYHIRRSVSKSHLRFGRLKKISSISNPSFALPCAETPPSTTQKGSTIQNTRTVDEEAAVKDDTAES